MQAQRFESCDLLQLFRALPDDFERVSLMKGQGLGGFADTLSWEPVAELAGHWEPRQDVPRLLADFVDENLQRGRLLVGLLSFELGERLHGLPVREKSGPRLFDYYWLAYENWLTLEGEALVAHYSNVGFIDRVQTLLPRAREVLALPDGDFERIMFKPIISNADYGQAYRRIKNYILAGDIYQVNLTHQLRGSTSLSDRVLFPFVAKHNAVEHLAYLEGDGFSIQSASPERFVKIDGQEIETLPIKGTRPRGADPDSDRERLNELLASEKEAAELNMITDLLRNDLSKVCRPGTVRVADSRVPRAGPKVWHTFSRVTGRLREHLRPMDAVLSMLPGGSISGCPKRRALEIIDELEQSHRGVYTGIIGRIAPGDNFDFSVAIRTLVKQGSELYLSVGGGIVHDSKEDQELEETVLKASSFMKLPARL